MRGYFGAYGGRFVPETLVAPIEELTAGYLAARADATFREELDRLLKHYVGRPTPLYEARRLAEVGGSGIGGGAARRGGDALRGPPPPRSFFQRGELTHTGGPQDQQRSWPGAARQAHGKDACRCRDWRGAARRRNGHGLRAAGSRMRRVHGLRRHAAAGAQCRPHGVAWREGPAR